jgi:hypothetical protein
MHALERCRPFEQVERVLKGALAESLCDINLSQRHKILQITIELAKFLRRQSDDAGCVQLLKDGWAACKDTISTPMIDSLAALVYEFSSLCDYETAIVISQAIFDYNIACHGLTSLGAVMASSELARLYITADRHDEAMSTMRNSLNHCLLVHCGHDSVMRAGEALGLHLQSQERWAAAEKIWRSVLKAVWPEVLSEDCPPLPSQYLEAKFEVVRRFAHCLSLKSFSSARRIYKKLYRQWRPEMKAIHQLTFG